MAIGMRRVSDSSWQCLADRRTASFRQSAVEDPEDLATSFAAAPLAARSLEC